MYYRYATLMRPAVPGAIPRDGLVGAIDATGLKLPNGHQVYSLVDYERKLTDEEVRDYELVFLNCFEGSEE